MKKLVNFSILALGLTSLCLSQVGIGTETPQATLDINGNLIIRLVPEIENLTGEDFILINNQTAPGEYEITQINSSKFLSSSTAYAAEKKGEWGLLSLGIPGSNWEKITLNSTDTKLGDPTHFSQGTYTAPSGGIYAVHYEFQLEGGVDIGILTNKRIGLIKNETNILAEKHFDAVRVSVGVLPVATIPITSTTLQSLVQLEEGDRLTFAVETGGISLSLLTQNKASLYLYKVAN